MKTLLERRKFLAQLPGMASAAAIPFLVDAGPACLAKAGSTQVCWLDVCAPFIIEDAKLGIHSEIILTSDTFIGREGFVDGKDATEYELLLYSSDGKALGNDGVAKRLTVPAMNATVISVRDLVGDGAEFLGGLIVRLRPNTRTPMHASDLFSSAFIRWKTDGAFDNVHANPDPIQWQAPKAFFYSMPFPSLAEYSCVYACFNPYPTRSVGELLVFDAFGRRSTRLRYDLPPWSTILFDLDSGDFAKRVADTSFGSHARSGSAFGSTLDGGGTIAVTNDPTSVKNFGYLMIKRRGTSRFSVEHPIHQSPPDPVPSKPPIDSTGRFRAKNILYSPLVFHKRRLGGITINSRFHLSSGAPPEDSLWLSPFIVDGNGEVPWQLTRLERTKMPISTKQIERGAIRLGGQQSCIIDTEKLGLPEDLSGGLSLPISPFANHTLMKAELRVEEWNAYAFTHFRPGLAAARGYGKPSQRGGLATDYITAGARLERDGDRILRDEIVCVLNIDDTGISGMPELQIFGPDGLLERAKLGEIRGFGCRHYLLSDLVSPKVNGRELSMRLVDDECILLMSVVHIDHVRRDIALDHGSDRFSTFNEFTCEPTGKYD